MEQSQGNPEDLQPQDLSLTCSLPTVIDLTRRSEECHSKASSIDALRVVKSSSWYTNSGSSKGLPLPDPASDHRLSSGDQIQPDDAFSNTTVMLSYVSRSHIFSSHDSLSQHTPLCGVPSNNKLSLHANPSKLGEGSEEMDEARLSQEVNQYYMHQQVENSLDLASQSKRLCRSTSPSRVAGETASGAWRTQRQSHEVNGGHAVTNGTVDRHRYGSVPLGQGHAQGAVSRKGIRGCQRSRSRSGVCVEASPEGHKGGSEERPRRGDSDERPESGDSEVLFLISSNEKPVLIEDSRSPQDLCALDSRSPQDLCALAREFVSPLEDPVSPSATSLEDVEEVFLLPQASRSPSADNSLAGDALDTRWDELERVGRGTCPAGNTYPLLLDSCGRYQDDVGTRTAASDAVIDLTEDCPVPDVLEKGDKDKDKAGSPHMNGNAREEQCSFERKKLPPRSGRGTRLEAIVMNINPTWYKVSGAARPDKKIKPPQSQIRSEISESEAEKDAVSAVTQKVKDSIALSSEKETKLHSEHTLNKGNGSMYVNADSCEESTSDSERTRFPELTHNSTTPKSASHAPAAEPPRQPSNLKPLSVVDATGVSQAEKPEQEIPSKHKGKSPGSKASPTAKSKTAPPPKRKGKKPSAMQPSMFAPNEPEIKLKYINYKEEKRDHRAMENFSPFIRVERKRSPATCTVINYPDEDRDRLKKGHPQPGLGGFIPGAVPTTSCLQLGRVSSHSQYQNSLVCCLCGGSANAIDLGDLHGPYYPEGYRPSTKTAASTGLKEEEEEEDSDSDSSFRARGRKGARPPGVWPHRPGPRLSQEGLLGKHPRWTSCTDSVSGPATKRGRTEPGAEALDGAGVLEEAGAGVLAREDWYAPPMVPLEPCEYWLHEDCSIWAAGVFLVKGKVYGLEEAVKVAQQTTCSGCHRQGATIGCFFKGCPNKYHYRCALQSDCVLTEENFSMKCRKHKNKSLKAPLGGRCDSR